MLLFSFSAAKKGRYSYERRVDAIQKSKSYWEGSNEDNVSSSTCGSGLTSAPSFHDDNATSAAVGSSGVRTKTSAEGRPPISAEQSSSNPHDILEGASNSTQGIETLHWTPMADVSNGRWDFKVYDQPFRPRLKCPT